MPSGSGVIADTEATHLADVVVTGVRPRGSVDGDIQPDIVLDAEQMKAYGASNISELLAAIEPLTRSGRGRSDSGPVMLLNGRRISGFQEIRSIPIEAIERTEILPEEVALTYGYSADQRVVNFVLKTSFKSLTTSLNGRGPSQGGRLTGEIDTSIFRLQDGVRWTLDVEHERSSALFESERNIDRSPGSQPFDLTGNVTGIPFGSAIDPALSALAGSPVTVAAVPTGKTNPTLADFLAGANNPSTDNLGDYRTLLPRSTRSTVRGSMARDLNNTTKLTVSGSLDDTSSESFQGLPGVVLTLPSTSPFTPFANDVRLYRYVDDAGSMKRNTDTLAANASALLDGYLGDWRWSLQGTFDRTETDTTTGRGLNATALQSQITAGTLNPFGDLPRAGLTSLQDTANSVSTGANAEAIMTGSFWQAPAGKLLSTFKLGFDTRTLDSKSVRSGQNIDRSQSRDRTYGSANFTLPIANRNREVLKPLGDLSVNFNLGYEDASDFGGLNTFGLGANWSPLEAVSFIVSYTDEHGAPSISQLNDPILSTINVPVYDFATGQTVNITQITGGNPNLNSDNRRVLKLGVNFKPFTQHDLSISSNYIRSTTDDVIASFPTITPALEAALPDRFVRDAAGNLLSIDARPLNFQGSEKQDLRTGFNFSRAFGKPNPSAGRGPGGPGGPGGGGGMMIMGGPPPGGGAPGGGGGFRAGGGGRGGGMQPGQGRFNLSVYHTWHIQDEITIRDGVPVLDLLNGDATGSRGGNPRNEIQVQGGVFRNGMGAFVNANWRESTQVNGGVNGASDLFFSDQTTVNLNVFADLSARTSWVAKFPWLKGARVNLGVDNLFDSRVEVRTNAGELPLNYQPDYLDPQGRVIRISLRKILF